MKRIAARIFCILLCITALTGLTIGCGEEPPEEKEYMASAMNPKSWTENN